MVRESRIVGRRGASRSKPSVLYLQENLAVQLRQDVDLVDLRAASTVMQMQVLSRGNVLVE
jgi:hypothetical protein